MSATSAVIWRWRDRTAASWSAIRSWEPEPPSEEEPGTPSGLSGSPSDEAGASGVGTEPSDEGDWDSSWSAYATVANVGDGPAYRVWVAGDGCSVQLNAGSHGWANGLLPVINPGETFDVFIQGEFENWNFSDVVVDWSPPPTRRRRRWFGLRTNRRRQYIPLPYVAPLPTSFDGMGDLQNTPSRWRAIRWYDDQRRNWRVWRRRSEFGETRGWGRMRIAVERLRRLDIIKRRLTVAAGILALLALVGAGLLYGLTQADARAGVVASSGVALAAYFARRLAPGEPENPTRWDWAELFLYGAIGCTAALFFGWFADPPPALIVAFTGLMLLALAAIPTVTALQRSSPAATRNARGGNSPEAREEFPSAST